jgi:hypothetical protein
LQEQASNHLKLLWSRARVVNIEEKSRLRIMAGEDQGDERKRTIDEVSKARGWRQNWRPFKLPGRVQGEPVYCLDGVRHNGGLNLI